jgi:DTW domain-containing protein YfiP
MFCAINFDHEAELIKLINDPNRHVLLVYPGPEACALDAQLPTQWKEQVLEKGKTLTLLLIDATWPCAKKMMKLSSCLHTLPTASFQNTYESQFLIKHQPNEMCLSTIETLIHALKGLQSMGLEEQSLPIENLWTPFKEMLNFQIKCAEDPDIPSNRGTKSSSTKRPKEIRVREKKNRLFYWDLKKSGSGDHHKKG